MLQFRHLRYFVKIVEAGSFSRAANTIHVAQPALSQQIAELEEQLGLTLLQRSARGVRPTPAGEVLYREASAILRQLEQLPGIVRSSSGEPEGVVSLGLAASLAGKIAGPFIGACRDAFPKITLRLSDGDSGGLAAKVEAKNLDMAVLYEDELIPIFFRVPMFRQRLFLVSKEFPLKGNGPAKLEQLTTIPLILPGRPDVRRTIIDRAFTAAGLTPNVIAEADTVGSELSLVRMGHAHTILPSGDMSNYAENAFCKPRLIEPPLFLTCSVISSSDFPLTHAGDSVRSKMVEFVRDHVTNAKPPGAEWVG